MTTNYKTSFLLPHDYEIPTFNYPEYVLPPVPYNYKPYTKDIMPSDVVQPLITKITAPPQCKKKMDNNLNLFNNKFNEGYYEIEIDLKQIDPTIQSIDKFISSYKIIEITNLNNLQVECKSPNIEDFIPNRNFNILFGNMNCNDGSRTLNDLTLQQEGSSQIDKVNFKFDINNKIVLDTNKIAVNDIKTLRTGYTNGISSDDYYNIYNNLRDNIPHYLKFLLQITKLSDNDNNKIKELYLQAYYTNDVKLKIRFSKIISAKFILSVNAYNFLNYLGNDKDITIDMSNPNYLGIRNKSDNPVKITIKPR